MDIGFELKFDMANVAWHFLFTLIFV